MKHFFYLNGVRQTKLSMLLALGFVGPILWQKIRNLSYYSVLTIFKNLSYAIF